MPHSNHRLYIRQPYVFVMVYAPSRALTCVVGGKRACLSISQEKRLKWREIIEGQPCLRGSCIKGRLQGSLG